MLTAVSYNIKYNVIFKVFGGLPGHVPVKNQLWKKEADDV